MIDFIKRMFNAASVEMPELPPVKKSVVLPSYLKSAKQSPDSFLPQDDLRLYNIDVEALRSSARATPELLRKLNKASPDLSAATYTTARMLVSSGYRALARNLDGTLNPEGTQLVQQLCRRFDLVGPVKGYNDYPSLRAAAESLATELGLLGGCAVELVLDQARLPEGIRPVSVEGLKFKYINKKKVPFQVVGGEEVSLDVPTFFYTSLDQDLKSPYAESPVQAALPGIQASQAFFNDLRRVFRRAIHPRVKAQIKEELWRKNVPPQVLHDPVQLKAFMDQTISGIQTLLNELNPEDALVMFDMLDIDYLVGGNNSLSEEYKTLSQIINAKLASGTKAMGVVLGHDSTGSTNIASTQSMLFVKSVSSLQFKINELYSRVLTLAVRLFGVDAVVEFVYTPIDLRPDLELEAFKAMKQSRVLEQVSLGITDMAEAALELTGSLPPPGAEDLTGTFFMSKAPAAANPTSNTSAGQGGALNQTLNPETPKAAKS